MPVGRDFEKQHPDAQNLVGRAGNRIFGGFSAISGGGGWLGVAAHTFFIATAAIAASIAKRLSVIWLGCRATCEAGRAVIVSAEGGFRFKEKTDRPTRPMHYAACRAAKNGAWAHDLTRIDIFIWIKEGKNSAGGAREIFEKNQCGSGHSGGRTVSQTYHPT